MSSSVKTLSKKELNDSICVVVGTRPSIVKLSPIIKELQRRHFNYFILHSGQHYSYNMDRIFFQDLNLPAPKYHLRRVSGLRFHGEQTAAMLKGAEKVFLEEKPRWVVVGGDANTNLAAAIAARKLQLGLAHTESGLRNYDWRVPEEHNRIMIEHISDILFAPNEKAMLNLAKDNVHGEVHIVGSTIVDAVLENKVIASKSTILSKLEVEKDGYFLLTMHREENLDFVDEITGIINGIKEVIKKYEYPIVFPAHPRTIKRLTELGLYQKLDKEKKIKLIPAVGYLDFLNLLSNAKLVLSDSGGVIQEACILRVPCVTLLKVTEWIETLEVGANVLSGSNPDKIIFSVDQMLDAKRNWRIPFGDGHSGEKIVEILIKKIEG
jgi:UDP-N-acetylglucosamine 2-epimerase (non-hydrolysing)